MLGALHESITCPQCGKMDVLNAFDALGADPGCVFCTSCHCEFESATGEIHQSAKEETTDADDQRA